MYRTYAIMNRLQNQVYICKDCGHEIVTSSEEQLLLNLQFPAPTQEGNVPAYTLNELFAFQCTAKDAPHDYKGECANKACSQHGKISAKFLTKVRRASGRTCSCVYSFCAIFYIANITRRCRRFALRVLHTATRLSS